ncbi:glycosyltransferase family 8 protein [Bauldia sp.]|uniref:glycosyltransferase family 8 protein n=1 Tax=Bauldia sp. TaxID=2575872 RepID=UPI003BA84A2B
MKLRPEYEHLRVEEVGEDRLTGGPPIVLCCDDNYAFPTRVTIASLLLNAPYRDFEIVVLANELDTPNVTAFDVLARRLGSAITIVHVTDAIMPDVFTNPYIARSTFLRLLLPDIFETDRLLYLDTDLVVQIDISSIWREYRPDMIVGGVSDPAARDWKRRLGSTEPDTYINNGVLMINCDAWRGADTTARCRDWLAEHGNNRQTILADQDTLNTVLAGSIYTIADHWNVNRNILRRERISDVGERYDQETFLGIFHFNGPQPKPWCRWADPWSQEFYLRYARIVGLPPNYWVEARSPEEALTEARWAEQRGDILKANAIYRRTAEALIEIMQNQNAAAAEQQAAPAVAD